MELAVPMPTGYTAGAYAVDVDVDGNMYGILTAGEAEGERPSFVKFDPDGNVLWEFVVEDHPDFPLSLGFVAYYFYDIAVDLDGNVGVVGEIYTPFFGHRTWIFLLDESGSETWQYMNESGSGFPENEDNVFPTRCCFDANGVLYVAFSPNGQDGNTGVIPDTDYLAVAAYEAGAELWRKTEFWDSGQQFNKWAADVCLSPNADQLAVLFYKIHPDGAITFSGRVDVYSGADYGTLDFTSSAGGSSTGAGQTPRGLCYCGYDKDGILWAGVGFHGLGGTIKFFNPDGTSAATTYTNTSVGSFERLCLAPGRHPIFLP